MSHTLDAPPAVTPLDRDQARRGLTVYLVVVALLSTPLYVAMVRTGAFDGDRTGLAWLVPFMLVPAVASLLTRTLTREGFADLARRRRTALGRRVTSRAMLLPLAVGLVAYSGAALAGLVELVVPPLVPWLAVIVVNVALNAVLVPGEELGWRGYVVPRLLAAGAPAPLAVGGLVWGLWHVPLWLWADVVDGGPHPVVQTLLLLSLTTALGYVLGRMQVLTGTVRAPVSLHVAWNVLIQTVFDPLARGAHKYLWVGEVGVLTVLVTVLLAVSYRLRPWGAGPGTRRTGRIAPHDVAST